MGQALVDQNFEYVKQLALRQAAWGADVLDVNVGVAGLDDVALMPEIVKLVAGCVDVPLCLVAIRLVKSIYDLQRAHAHA